MRIGVACEGETDFIAIKHFVSKALTLRGKSVELVGLQPAPDQTRSSAGWSNLLNWLRNNPPVDRVKNYLSLGLFGNELSAKSCDAIIIQMDSDVLGEPSFEAFIEKNYEFKPLNPNSPNERGQEIIKVISIASGLDVLSQRDNERHVILPALESTESWCVAAFYPVPQNIYFLRGQGLVDSFMSALEMSESRQANTPYSVIDKSRRRREKFCQRHDSGVTRIEAQCSFFQEAIARIENI